MTATGDRNRHTGKTSSDDRLDAGASRPDPCGKCGAVQQIGTELPG